jgi:uncharacterized membrane-anchored protein
MEFLTKAGPFQITVIVAVILAQIAIVILVVWWIIRKVNRKKNLGSSGRT